MNTDLIKHEGSVAHAVAKSLSNNIKTTVCGINLVVGPDCRFNLRSNYILNFDRPEAEVTCVRCIASLRRTRRLEEDNNKVKKVDKASVKVYHEVFNNQGQPENIYGATSCQAAAVGYCEGFGLMMTDIKSIREVHIKRVVFPTLTTMFIE